MATNSVHTILPGAFNPAQPEYWLLVGMVVLVVVCAALFMAFGRDTKPRKGTFRGMPEGPVPTEMGFVEDGYVDYRDILALFPYWAEKGCLQFRRNGNEYRLIRTGELGAGARPYERYLFDRIFVHGSSVEASDFNWLFKQALNHARKMAVRSLYGEGGVFTRASAFLRPAFAVLASLPVLLTLALSLRRSMGAVDAALVASAIVGVAVLTPIFLLIRLMRCWRGLTRAYRAAHLFSTLTALTLFFSGFLLLAGDPSFPWLPAISAACTAAIGLCSVFITKRTQYGQELYCRASDFRQFLESGREDEEYPGNDSGCFYRILPYAYALGLHKEWARRFDNRKISAPPWLAGYGNHFYAGQFAEDIAGHLFAFFHSMTYKPPGMAHAMGT